VSVSYPNLICYEDDIEVLAGIYDHNFQFRAETKQLALQGLRAQLIDALTQVEQAMKEKV
jgi:hypothetical protein